jgi:hypothetical protein
MITALITEQLAGWVVPKYDATKAKSEAVKRGGN